MSVLDSPIYNVGVDSVIKSAEIVAENDGNLTIDVLEEELDLDGGRRVGRIKNAGLKLSLFEESGNEVEITELGAKVADKESREEGLQEAIINFRPYQKILESFDSDTKILEKPDVAEIFEQEYMMSENTSEYSALFLFKLCHRAGIAVYRRGSGSRPSRMKFNDGFNPQKVLQKTPSVKEENNTDKNLKEFEETNSVTVKSELLKEGVETVELEDKYDLEKLETIFKMIKGRWKEKHGRD